MVLWHSSYGVSHEQLTIFLANTRVSMPKLAGVTQGVHTVWAAATRCATASSSGPASRRTVPRAVLVPCVVALDPLLRHVVKRGAARTVPERDHAVKIDADGLRHDTNYYDQSQSRGVASVVCKSWAVDTVVSVGNIQPFGVAFEVQHGSNRLQPSALTTPGNAAPALAP